MREAQRAARATIGEAIDKRLSRLIALLDEAKALGVATRSFGGRVSAQLHGIYDLRDTLLAWKEDKAEPTESE